MQAIFDGHRLEGNSTIWNILPVYSIAFVVNVLLYSLVGLLIWPVLRFFVRQQAGHPEPSHGTRLIVPPPGAAKSTRFRKAKWHRRKVNALSCRHSTYIRSIHQMRSIAITAPTMCTTQSPAVFGLPKLNICEW